MGGGNFGWKIDVTDFSQNFNRLSFLRIGVQFRGGKGRWGGGGMGGGVGASAYQMTNFQ